jgi:hypothetical protein
MHATVRELLDEAVRRGEIPEVDGVYAADVLLAAMTPDVYLFLRKERGYSPEEMKQHFRSVCLLPLFRYGRSDSWSHHPD